MSETPATSQSLSCRNCGAPLTLRAPGFTSFIVCDSCHATNDATNPSILTLIEAAKKTTLHPFIPLGRRGKMDDILWEVIGFMRRSDASGQYLWDEYLLFNPCFGFRWLMEYQGHWIFYKMIKDRVETNYTGGMKRKNINYAIFLKGKAVVQYVLGEFYWRVKTGDKTGVFDYVAAPEILSCEVDEKEKIWSHGIYKEPEEIQKAFQIEKPMPRRSGVGACQPSPYAKNLSKLWMLVFVFFCFMTLLETAQFSASKNENILEQNFEFLSNSENKILVSPSFHLSNLANLKISSHAPLQNNWIFLNFNLINEDNNENYSVSRELSYYSGYDSDGSWSEGSNRDDFFLSSIPEGNYHLVINPELPPEIKNQYFDVKIERDVLSFWNYFVCCVLLFAYPLYFKLRGWWFENQRWQESDTGTGY